MACPISFGSSLAEINSFLETLPLAPLPAPYKDSWSGCQVSFGIGRIGEGPREGEPTVAWNVNNCIKGGWDPTYRALVKAIQLHCESRAPILPPDPSYAFDPIPPPTKVAEPAPAPAPAPVVQPVAQYSGPLLTSSAQEENVYTIVPAPSQVPVSTSRPVSGGTIAVPTRTVSPQAPSPGLIDAIVGGVTGFVTGGPAGAVVGAVTGAFTGGGETRTSPGTQPTGYGPSNTFAAGCPTGYRWENGQCVKEGIGGWVERALPGGSTGTMPPQGTAVSTQGGIMPGAVAPAVYATQRSRCPKGFVLGYDGWCYHKSAISNKQRKWPKGSRPLLTGGEMKTLRKIKSLENKVKRAWTAAGKPGQRTCRRK